MTTARRYALFDTALGVCGVCWTAPDVIVAVALPEDDRADMERYLASFDAEPGAPAPVAGTIDLIRGLMAGSDVDLSAVPVDIADLPDFDRRVYAITRDIPRGRVLTYGAVASRLGQPGAAQAVGRALGRNPIPVVIPCHRVVGAGTEVGGFSAPGGAATKSRILAAEKVSGFGEPTLF
ncbi:methylated-DNA--[protein]-cysteine S-methyltransferase [Williamsia sp. MIQD14]|uniref:methylated-DNA--[protein]-cysteine S-methyltransferase n=1 Tax=Williamsia sp. MIQD14 TaxID=3425703 RepID=UPI003DA0452B